MISKERYFLYKIVCVVFNQDAPDRFSSGVFFIMKSNLSKIKNV
jgi:hypothetical protein